LDASFECSHSVSMNAMIGLQGRKWMKHPTEADFKVAASDAAVTVTFLPTKSTYTFYRLADAKDIEQYGPIMPGPDNAHHGGPTGDTGDYLSHEVQEMAHRVAVKALIG